MKFKRYLIENLNESKVEISGQYYEQLMKHSPIFKKYTSMKKTNLIKELGKKLWMQRNREGRILDAEKEIATRKYSNLEMAYLLYQIEYSNGKL